MHEISTLSHVPHFPLIGFALTAFTKNLTDLNFPSDSGFALQVDGANQYLSLGLMGTFGSNLSNGFYCKFLIKTTSTSKGYWGYINTSGKTQITIGLNSDESGNNVSGKIRLYLGDESNNIIQGATTSATNFNDGQVHTIEIIWTPGNTTFTINVDGAAKPITYTLQQTLGTFANFAAGFAIGARWAFTVYTNFGCACVIDDFKIGTSSGNIYASYSFDDKTATDLSGNNNTGTLATTLTNGSLPSFVTGLTVQNTLLKTISKAVSDLISPSEVLTYLSTLYRSLTDSVILQETLNKAIEVVKSDIATILQETLSKAMGAMKNDIANGFGFLLNEDGSYVLNEDGSKIQIESPSNFIEAFTKRQQKNLLDIGGIISYLLNEDGSYVLQENGDKIVKDGNPEYGESVKKQIQKIPLVDKSGIPSYLLNENGSYVLQEDGSRIEVDCPPSYNETLQRKALKLISDIAGVISYLLNEDGSYVLREDGSRIFLDNPPSYNETLKPRQQRVLLDMAGYTESFQKAINKIFMLANQNSPVGIACHLQGLSNDHLISQLLMMRDAGVKWARFDFYMNVIQPSQGVFVWTDYDYIINMASSYGINVIALMSQVNMPGWANGNQASNVPPSPDIYGDWCQAVAEHYAGQVTYFEMGNEPNRDRFWGGLYDPAGYTALLQAGYLGTKAGNPEAKVISAGLSGTSSTGIPADSFLTAMYANGAKGYFDYFGIHPYSQPNGPDIGFLLLDHCLVVMSTNGDGDKQMIITELGWPTYTGSDGVTEVTQAQDIGRAFQKILYENYQYVKVCCIYEMVDAGVNNTNREYNFGILHHDYSPKPAYYTIQSVSSFIRPSNFAEIFIKSVSKAFTGAISLIESFRHLASFLRVFTGAITQTEYFAKATVKKMATIVSLTEVFRFAGAFSRTLTDAITLLDNLTTQAAKTIVFLEQILLTEVFDKIVRYLQIVIDTISPQETFSKSIGKVVFTEIITLSEVLKKIFTETSKHIPGQKLYRRIRQLFTYAGNLYNKKPGDEYN